MARLQQHCPHCGIHLQISTDRPRLLQKRALYLIQETATKVQNISENAAFNSDLHFCKDLNFIENCVWYLPQLYIVVLYFSEIWVLKYHQRNPKNNERDHVVVTSIVFTVQ